MLTPASYEFCGTGTFSVKGQQVIYKTKRAVVKRPDQEVDRVEWYRMKAVDFEGHIGNTICPGGV
jgi:hypothetical protein